MNIRSLLLYGGLEKSEYNEVVGSIEEKNNKILIVSSALASVLIGIMFILSLRVEEYIDAKIVYGVGGILSVIVLLCSLFVVKKNRIFTHIMTALCIEIYMVYGIYVSGVINKGYPAVSFVALMIFMSLLFVERPITVNMLVLVNVMIFNYISFHNKSISYAIMDLINTLVFWLLSFTWSCVTLSSRIKGMYADKQLHEMAEIDQLTKLKNRNCFELSVKSYSALYKKSICCIYIDVNGLHQLNNSSGHEAGDEMLKYVAERISRYFGYEHTYRIGGDEYIIFSIDEVEDNIINSILLLSNDIKTAGYSISMGYEYSNSKCNIRDLIKTAERAMFIDKNNYYRKNNIVR